MAESSVVHIPVMVEEVLHWLQPRPGGVVVDGTLGGGGHTRALAERVGPQGIVVAVDRDPAAVVAAERNLAGLPVKLVHGNFCDLPEALRELGIAAVDGVMLDLGMSSEQLADPERGFSFSSAGLLDLRFDPTRGEPAYRLINRLSPSHLADLIYAYGEERYSRRIALAIAERRRKQPIQTAAQLAEVVRQAIPSGPGPQRIDPATRTFQALRIATNDELKSLEIALRRIPGCLRPEGRLAVISFHSLEDRLVKEAMRRDPRLEMLTKKPVMAGDAETAPTRAPAAQSSRGSPAERYQRWGGSMKAERKKGTGTFCRNGPSGAPHKRCLSPFPA